MMVKPERVAAAAECVAAGVRLMFDLPPGEAARRAYVPGGPPVAELERRITARTGRGSPAAA